MLALTSMLLTVGYFITGTKACGGFFDASALLQNITFTGDPQTSMYNCEWVINATSPSKYIYLRVVGLSGAGSLEIREGGELVGKVSVGAKDVRYVVNNQIASIRYVGAQSITSRNYEPQIFSVTQSFLVQMQYQEVDPCGTNLFDSATFQSPGFPSSVPANTRCGWNLRLTSSITNYIMELRFRNVGLAKGADRFQVYDLTKLLGNVNGNMSFYHTSYLRVYIETNAISSSNVAFNASFTYGACVKNLIATDKSQELTSPGYPYLRYDRGFSCSWKFTAANNSKSIDAQTLHLASIPLFISQGFYNTYNNLSFVLQVTRIDVRIFRAIRGFRLLYSQVSKCGFESRTVLNGSLSSPNFPQPAPPNVKCGWIIHKTSRVERTNVFRLTINSLQTQGGNGILQVYDGNGLMGDLNTYPQYRDFASDSILRVYYESGPDYGMPFSANYSYQTCTKALKATATPQTVTSPGFPYYKPQDILCKVSITPTRPSMSILLKVSGHPNFTGCCSRTQIFEETRRLGLLLHNNMGVHKVIAHQFPINIEYDGRSQGRGFSIEFSEVPTCGYSTNATTGNVTSPNYPNNADSGVLCGWNVYYPQNVPGGTRVFVLNNFQIGQNTTFKISNELLANQPTLNNTIQKQLFVFSGAMQIYFKTSKLIPSGSNFIGDFSSRVCGGNLVANNTEQMAYAYGLPGITPVNLQSCSWRIDFNPAKSLYIEMVRFGKTNTDRIITFQITGLTMIRRPTDNVKLITHDTPANLYDSGYGVTFKFKEIPRCGRNMLGGSGIFSSSEIPATNQSRILCSWKITTSRVSTMRLQVFNTSSPTSVLKVYHSSNGLWATVRPGDSFQFYGVRNVFIFLELNLTAKQHIAFNGSFASQNCNWRGNVSEAKKNLNLFTSESIYADRVSCTWEISPSNLSNSIHANIINLYTKPESTVQLQLNDIGNLGGDFQAPKQDINIVTHSNQLNVILIMYNVNGFAPLKVEVNEVSRCGSDITVGNSTIVSSEGFPNFAQPNRICGWSLLLRGSNYLNFRFLQMNLQASDKLELYNRNKKISKFGLREFLNATLPLNQFLRIYFETKGDSKQSRFSAQASILEQVNTRDCGGNLTATPQWQELKSRGYPYNQLPGVFCSWIISPSTPKNEIHIEIVDLSLMRDGSLRITDLSRNSAGHYNGSVSNLSLLMTKGVFITFQTRYQDGRGFFLRYKEAATIPPNVCANTTCHKTLATCKPTSDNSTYTCMCMANYEGDGISCKPFCNGTGYDSVTGKAYTFGRASIGDSPNSVEKCRNGRSIASAVCVQSTVDPKVATFDKLHTLPCSTNLSTILSKALQLPATTESVSIQITDLKLLTSSSTVNLTSEETAAVANTLLQLSQKDPAKVQITRQSLLDTLLVTDQVSASLPNGKVHTQKLEEQQKILIKVLQDFTDRVLMPGNATSLTLITKTITVQVEEQTPKAGKYFDVTFAPKPQSGIAYKPPINFVIPAKLIEQAAMSISSNYGRAKRNIANRPVRVSFVLHETNALFPPVEDDISEVITARIKNFTVPNTKQTVNITFNNRTTRQGSVRLPSNPLKEKVTRTQCVNLDQNMFRWVPKTCRLVSGPDGDPRFHCHQLGHFAMIVKSVVLPSAHALHVATYIGCGLSIVGLVLTLVIYGSVKALRIKKPTLFLLNICFCLLVVNIIFLTSAGNVNNRTGCYVSTAFLQYFLLATWFWMSANAYDLYNALVKVMSTSSDKIRNSSVIVAYFVPFLIVLINACVAILVHDLPRYRPDDNLFISSYQARHMCWVHLGSLHYGFLLPIGLLTIFNLVLFVIVFTSLTCKKEKIRSSAQKRTSSQDFMVAITLILMMGLTWIFGFLMLLAEDVTYQEIMAWLFTIVNSLQGFFIFLVNCVRNPSVRNLWLHPVLKTFGCRRFIATSTTVNSSRSGTSDVGLTKTRSQQKSEASETAQL